MSYLPDDYIMDCSKRIETIIRVYFYDEFGEEIAQQHLNVSYIIVNSETISNVEVDLPKESILKQSDYYIEDIKFSIEYELKYKIEGPLNFIS